MIDINYYFAAWAHKELNMWQNHKLAELSKKTPATPCNCTRKTSSTELKYRINYQNTSPSIKSNIYRNQSSVALMTYTICTNPTFTNKILRWKITSIPYMGVTLMGDMACDRHNPHHEAHSDTGACVYPIYLLVADNLELLDTSLLMQTSVA